MRWNWYYIILVFLVVACDPVPDAPTNLEVTIDKTVTATQEQPQTVEATSKIIPSPIPDALDFAGEAVPLDDPDVLERFDRELLVNNYWQSQTLLFHKRANRWFPVIEPILAKNGIPDDFKFLAIIESGLTQAVSPSGAAGFWQFMRATGEGYNLEITEEVDERYHVEKSTQAACEYLQKSYDRFGSWTAAAAAYNMGSGGLNNQMTRQLTEDYYSLLLNNETSRYVFRILAVKTILNNSETYGFYLNDSELYAPYSFDTVRVDTSIVNIAEWAQALNCSYKEVKILNPWLRQNYLMVYDKTYTIKLPKK